MSKIKEFCKKYNLKFEDFNESSNILVTSKICKIKKYKDNINLLKGKKEDHKYRFFEYYKVVNYESYVDCITIHNEKMPFNYISAILTSNMINFLNQKYETTNQSKQSKCV